MNKKPFNVKFGRVLRGARIGQGFDRPQDFAEAVAGLTGVHITRDTMQRIEAGRQGATLEQYAAFLLTLYGRVDDSRLITDTYARGGFQ